MIPVSAKMLYQKIMENFLRSGRSQEKSRKMKVERVATLNDSKTGPTIEF